MSDTEIKFICPMCKNTKLYRRIGGIRADQEIFPMRSEIDGKDYIALGEFEDDYDDSSVIYFVCGKCGHYIKTENELIITDEDELIDWLKEQEKSRNE